MLLAASAILYGIGYDLRPEKPVVLLIVEEYGYRCRVPANGEERLLDLQHHGILKQD